MTSYSKLFLFPSKLTLATTKLFQTSTITTRTPTPPPPYTHSPTIPAKTTTTPMSQQTQQPLAQAGQAAQNVADRARQATQKLTSEVSTKLHHAPEVTERGVEKALGFVWPVWGYAKEVTGWGAGVLQEGMRRYPPLKVSLVCFVLGALLDQLVGVELCADGGNGKLTASCQTFARLGFSCTSSEQR